MDRFADQGRTKGPGRRRAAAVAAVFSIAVLAFAPQPAGAAGLSLPVPLGQRFIGSASPAKSLGLPLATKVGPIRPLAVAGINSTTFDPIKIPVIGTTIFSSGEVKEIILDTINGLNDNTTLAFRVNSLDHPNTGEFTIGGNCVGADGATTPFCLATIVFKPTSAGGKLDPISAQITITQGMTEVEDSLHNALANQGIAGSLVNIAYPLIRTDIQDQMTTGIESALLAPVAVASGTGVDGPFTDPSVFIQRQHRDFDGGTPSAAVVAAWVKNFEDGTAPAQLIDNLRRSNAWHGRVGPVTRLYSAYFLRSPDTDGLKFWIGRSKTGTRLYAISSNFAASSEFTRRYGALTNSEFVSLVYQNVLGRAPDATGLSYWTKQLNNGTSRGRVMVGFSESSEYQRKQGPNTAVVELWWGMLHRAPTPPELTGYSTRIKNGGSILTIINELMASTEYKTIVLG